MEWAVIFATLMGPLFAVQATEWLGRRRQVREQQMRIFQTLMATRATNLDPRHVEALNMIDVVFHSSARQQAEIRGLWKAYLDHLSNKDYPKETWGVERVRLLVEMLHAMAVFLGFNFDKTHIKNQTYFPTGYGERENEYDMNRRLLGELLSGKRLLPLWIANLSNETPQPMPPEGSQEAAPGKSA